MPLTSRRCCCPSAGKTTPMPASKARPQEIINKQIVREADILVGFFWTRLGTATGKAESGSAEEIMEFLDAGKPVLIYRSNQPVRMDSVNQEQYAALVKFLDGLRTKGVIFDYDNLHQLRELLSGHLLKTVRERFPTAASQSAAPAEKGKAEARYSLESLVKRPAIAWGHERDSATHTDAEGKDILDGLYRSLLEWRANYDTAVASDILTDVDAMLRNLKALLQHRLALDGGVSWKAFWDGGNDVFTGLERIVKRLTAVRSDHSLSEGASELLREIDSHEEETERGITIVDGRSLGPGLGHSFPYQWNSIVHGGGAVNVGPLAPVRKSVGELATKRYLEKVSDDGKFAIYARTGKPLPDQG
jgi:hypothetical protein